MNYSIKISDFLANIADAFAGDYNHKNEEINEIRRDVLDISIIPNPGDDKKALKNDFDKLQQNCGKDTNMSQVTDSLHNIKTRAKQVIEEDNITMTPERGQLRLFRLRGCRSLIRVHRSPRMSSGHLVAPVTAMINSAGYQQDGPNFSRFSPRPRWPSGPFGFQYRKEKL